MDSSPNRTPSAGLGVAIPSKCTVLVIGGGPGGSYAASALAREGLDVVLLEADVFPRYHIGETMLPSARPLLRFIDLEETFNNYGFAKKIGAAFKMNKRNREGYTDFLAAYGADQHTWNVKRSESDDLLFRHAAKSGAKIFDGVKVTSVAFEGDGDPTTARPVRASYSRKFDETTGEISFEYLIDASGRVGLMSTKYLKNRTVNLALKNVAWWGYWQGTTPYAAGTSRENVPFFEALTDESGWVWVIPLAHATSVGLVMNKEIATKKKQAQTPSPSTQEFYLEQLKLAPNVYELLRTGKLVDAPDGRPIIQAASDYSYSASAYSGPHFRIIGDAGSFVDPFFSAGMHLAFTGALSASASICAAMRGDCSEEVAASWHTDRVGTSYTWFLMVVLGAYKQMRSQNAPVLSEVNEGNFDRAFVNLRPVIQGALDVDRSLSQDEISKTLEFFSQAFEAALPEECEAVLEKVGAGASNGPAKPVNGDAAVKIAMADMKANLTQEEKRVLDFINARKSMRMHDALGMSCFSSDVVSGRRPRLERGKLGLMPAGAESITSH